MAWAFASGVALGLAVHGLRTQAPDLWATVEPAVEVVRRYGTQPVAAVFLRLVFMLVVPLLLSAIVLGVLEMRDLRAFGRVGRRALAFTVGMSAVAVGLALGLVHLLRPGHGVEPHRAAELMDAALSRTSAITRNLPERPTGVDLVVSIVPDNVLAAASDNGAILSVMFVASMLGVVLLMTRTEGTATLIRGIEGLFDVTTKAVDLVLRLAPWAVFCLMFDTTLSLGWDVLGKLAGYVGVVLLGLGIQLLVSYPIALRVFSSLSPLAFFRGVRSVMLLAFTTASSNATLPTALRVADEELHLPRHVSRFVLTVGATANQNGTALFEGITVLFLAQFFDVELSLTQQLTVMVVCLLGGIGTAGVPSGSLPVIAMICAMVGVRPEGIGLILGVNHLLDMCRTTVNVTGDLAIAAMVSRDEQTGAPAITPLTSS